MGEHLIDGEFQSDKYPSTPRGCVPLKCSDPVAQPLLWDYAQYHRFKDPAFSTDVIQALKNKGYDHNETVFETMARLMLRLHLEMKHGRDEGPETFSDQLRDDMDKPWHQLTPWGRETINALSMILNDNDFTKDHQSKRHCNACKVEAEFGTSEDPHPISEKFHTCKRDKKEEV